MNFSLYPCLSKILLLCTFRLTLSSHVMDISYWAVLHLIEFPGVALHIVSLYTVYPFQAGEHFLHPAWELSPGQLCVCKLGVTKPGGDWLDSKVLIILAPPVRHLEGIEEGGRRGELHAWKVRVPHVILSEKSFQNLPAWDYWILNAEKVIIAMVLCQEQLECSFILQCSYYRDCCKTHLNSTLTWTALTPLAGSFCTTIT